MFLEDELFFRNNFEMLFMVVLLIGSLVLFFSRVVGFSFFFGCLLIMRGCYLVYIEWEFCL